MRYTVIYTVSDAAGNERRVNREVLVIAQDIFRVFVNGVDAQEAPVFATPTLHLGIFNSTGDAIIKWKAGRIGRGEMKAQAAVLVGTEFTADKIGWYTFYIQDQALETRLIQVFVSSTEEQGGR